MPFFAGIATLGSYVIPEQVEILVFPQLMQRDERNWSVSQSVSQSHSLRLCVAGHAVDI